MFSSCCGCKRNPSIQKERIPDEEIVNSSSCRNDDENDNMIITTIGGGGGGGASTTTQSDPMKTETDLVTTNDTNSSQIINKDAITIITSEKHTTNSEKKFKKNYMDENENDGCRRIRLKSDTSSDTDKISQNVPIIEDNNTNNICINNINDDDDDDDAAVNKITKDINNKQLEANIIINNTNNKTKNYNNNNDNNDNDNGDDQSLKKSCLSRGESAKRRPPHKKSVNYSDDTEIITTSFDDNIILNYDNDIVDDDEVFSDSVPPKLPRGDMCTPYPKKRGSLSGLMVLPDWFNDDREVGGKLEPPVTPIAIGRDELALKRHRFFSELLSAAQAAVEHRVRFDPLGPDIPLNDTCTGDCDPNLQPSATVELGHLVNRLEKIVDRLERSVSAKELEFVNKTFGRSVIERNQSEEIDNLPLPSLPTTPNFQVLTNVSTKLLEQNSNINSNIYNNNIINDENNYTIIGNSNNDDTNLNNYTNFINSDDLANIPTVIDLICSTTTAEDYLSQEIPDYLPPVAMSVNGFQDIVNGSLTQYFTLSKKIGGDVALHADLVKNAFGAQLQYITLASTCKKPSDAQQMDLLKPTSNQISAIQDFREKHRTSTFFNHLSAISESIPALGWVCVSPTPGPHVKEMNDAGQFYTNRVLKDWKEKDTTHVEWVRAWVQTLTELQQYIKQYHTTGLVWSGKTEVSSGSCPPPPPPGIPPPPPALPPLGDLSIGGGNDERSALFAQINQGQDITKGLKKVTSDMQTHKNPAVRAGPAPFKAPKPGPVASVAAAAPAVGANKAPVFNRDGKKWIIEYQKSNPSLLVENAEMNNVVYVFKCENSTLTVKGKINSIIMDSCKKCSILFDAVVSSVEFVNCQSVQVQVIGTVPTISIDKTDGCQMYLSDQSLGVEIISSKSSEMNVLIPTGGGDYVEQPIPEQYKTTINGKSLKTICVESLG